LKNTGLDMGYLLNQTGQGKRDFVMGFQSIHNPLFLSRVIYKTLYVKSFA